MATSKVGVRANRLFHAFMHLVGVNGASVVAEKSGSEDAKR